jgi:outer membrane protein assembly factor BamE (lipoprotein component of BamABCDE complex)
MKQFGLLSLGIFGLAALLTGCAVPLATAPVSASTNQLTTGQVQLTLKKNETTQDQVVEAFGAPNLVTTNAAGEDVWTYQRHATVAQANQQNAYGTIILFGASSSSSGFEQSSRTMTLIIKFREVNGAKRVVDFQSRSSSF